MFNLSQLAFVESQVRGLPGVEKEFILVDLVKQIDFLMQKFEDAFSAYRSNRPILTDKLISEIQHGIVDRERKQT